LTPPHTQRKLFACLPLTCCKRSRSLASSPPPTCSAWWRWRATARTPKNSVILFEDDPGDALYVVAKGQVKVVLIGEDGREVILSVLGEGEFFGEMALIDDEPRSAHVIAMEDSTLYVLRREDFQGILEHSPGIGLALLRELSRRLRRVDEKSAASSCSTCMAASPSCCSTSPTKRTASASRAVSPITPSPR